MSTLIQQYIANIQSEFDTGKTTEHSFRPALKTLLEGINTSIIALNESQRITGVGMPDFTIKHKNNTTINIGRIEAKDLYIDLDEKKNKDQLGRYLGAFDNFIYTNNLTFNFYRRGKRIETVSLGTATKKEITRQTSDLFADNLTKLKRLLTDFLQYEGQTISSSENLARAMAQKAQLIKYAIQTIFQTHTEPAIESQYAWFKEKLIHDLTTEQFADMYAQTITYGLMAARLVDPTLENFSRAEAQRLLPNTSPFLKQLFKQIANDDELDEGIKYIIDDLVNIFLHCNVRDLLEDYGKSTSRNDPIVHFYETFLAEYDHKLRKQRGVWYTPEPVVKFIVRGVDHLLTNEFGLTRGLASSETIEHTFIRQGKKVKQTIPRVQVLDPATGTGTFLDETIKFVYNTYFKGQGGIWKSFVKNDFLPRLHGFEILMASYTMAHLKLGLTLAETYSDDLDHDKQILEGMGQVDSRLQIYLTNSLEQGVSDDQGLFSSFQRSFADEARAANRIKTEQPIMVVMGNPPYAVSSSNKGTYINNLIKPYKEDLQGESNIKPLSNDYVKFIRLAEKNIESKGEGIVGYVTSNTYLDGLVHKTMRRHLLQTFNTIYIINLFGNTIKLDKGEEYTKDENVFDIKDTGIAIIFGIKNNSKHKKILYSQILGTRDLKYKTLSNTGLDGIDWNEIKPSFNNKFLFKPSNFDSSDYKDFISLKNLFVKGTLGFLTKRDRITISFDKSILNNLINDFRTISKESLLIKYPIGKDSRDWKIDNAVKDIKDNYTKVQFVNYRCFDHRYTMYSGKVKGFMAYPNSGILNNIGNGGSIGLLTQRQTYGNKFNHAFLTNTKCDQNIISNLGGGTVFPLYLYSTDLEGNTTRTPNLDPVLIKQITEKLGVEWVDDQEIRLSPSPSLREGSYLDSLSQGESIKQVSPSQRGIKGENTTRSKPVFTENEIKSRGLICSGKHLPYNPNNKSKAKELRKNMTLHEGLIWDRIRKQEFRTLRQHTIDHYIVDFYVASAGLVIEIDGDTHSSEQAREYDEHRTTLLEVYNLEVIRFTNSQVVEDFETVSSSILSKVEERVATKLSPCPSLREGSDSTINSSLGESSDKTIFLSQSENTSKVSPSQRGTKGELHTTIGPVDLFDYIYAVLHSPTYRDTYSEFLKIDFPRIPFTDDLEIFWKLVSLGRQLRGLHLMETISIDDFITTYPIEGDNEVGKIGKGSFKLSPSPSLGEGSDGTIDPSLGESSDETVFLSQSEHTPKISPSQRGIKGEKKRLLGKVYINDTQYFDGVPQIARDFYIGGYQPAQKRLKDRKNRILSYDDIMHYQKIIVALTQTARLMEDIRGVEFL